MYKMYHYFLAIEKEDEMQLCFVKWVCSSKILVHMSSSEGKRNKAGSGIMRQPKAWWFQVSLSVDSLLLLPWPVLMTRQREGGGGLSSLQDGFSKFRFQTKLLFSTSHSLWEQRWMKCVILRWVLKETLEIILSKIWRTTVTKSRDNGKWENSVKAGAA